MAFMKTILSHPGRFIVALALTTLAGANVGRAALSPAASSSAHVDLAGVDRSFIEKAAKAGMEEVDASRVAQERSSNPDVRALASTIINDHESANATLAALAAAKGVTIPAKDLDTVKKWSKQDSKSFDHEYLSKMVSDHEDAVKLFQKQAVEGKDEETVAFARKVLPKLQHHLQLANDLKKVLK